MIKKSKSVNKTPVCYIMWILIALGFGMRWQHASTTSLPIAWLKDKKLSSTDHSKAQSFLWTLCAMMRTTVKVNWSTWNLCNAQFVCTHYCFRAHYRELVSTLGVLRSIVFSEQKAIIIIHHDLIACPLFIWFRIFAARSMCKTNFHRIQVLWRSIQIAGRPYCWERHNYQANLLVCLIHYSFLWVFHAFKYINDTQVPNQKQRCNCFCYIVLYMGSLTKGSLVHSYLNFA